MTEIGTRIQVIGSSCTGKSTLGARLSERLEIPFVELDALNWLPNWVALTVTDPPRFEQRVREATQGDAWVVAGSYRGPCQRVFWDRLQTIIWLDLPLHILVRRVLVRSWTRWRTQELLWGTNTERFWVQLKVWDPEESLLAYILRQYWRKRRVLEGCMSDPRWSHIQFIRLRSVDEINEFVTAGN